MTTTLEHDPPSASPPSASPPAAISSGGVPVAIGLMLAAIEAAPRGDDLEVGVLSEAELIDQIAALEVLGGAVSALQADRIRAFARAHAASRADLEGEGLEPRKLERSIAAQVGSACRVSPTVGRTRLRTARDLHGGLDHVRDQYTRGQLSREKTAAIVSGTADLDTDERAEVDAELAGQNLTTLGMGRLRDLVRKAAGRVAPEKVRARAAAAVKGRRVTLRPGEDGMCWLTAHLPTEQGAACLAILNKAVRAVWTDARSLVTRSKGQIMVDTLVERLTGQATAEAVSVEVQAIVPVEALLDLDSALPAEIPGLGQVPLERLLSSRAGKLTLRRLLTRDGIVIGGDSRQRSFTGVLAELVKARDGHRCREVYCDAPVRHIDHIDRHADGGETAFNKGSTPIGRVGCASSTTTSANSPAGTSEPPPRA